MVLISGLTHGLSIPAPPVSVIPVTDKPRLPEAALINIVIGSPESENSDLLEDRGPV